jgi:hypothetical protein
MVNNAWLSNFAQQTLEFTSIISNFNHCLKFQMENELIISRGNSGTTEGFSQSMRLFSMMLFLIVFDMTII